MSKRTRCGPRYLEGPKGDPITPATIPDLVADLRAAVLLKRGEFEVYFVECVGMGFYKIGVSKIGGSSKRLEHHQVGCPFELRIAGIIGPVDKFVEADLQRLFRYYHHRGEWFALDSVALEICRRVWEIDIPSEREREAKRQKRLEQNRASAKRAFDRKMASVSLEDMRLAMAAISTRLPAQ